MANCLDTPIERDPDAVLADVLAGKVSEAEAFSVYGVVVRSAEGIVDAAATAELRARRAGGQPDAPGQACDLAGPRAQPDSGARE
jgi:N-methylhydantoinase B